MATKHIILGAGGSIGNVLTDELLSKGEKIKLVSRSGQGPANVETAKADLANFNELNAAIDESAIVYLVAGLQYNVNIWQDQWPRIMHNVVESCEARNARLIFFDNVYSYGKVDGAMTEDTPFNPCSKKGEVRAGIAQYLMSEIEQRNINAIIARAADFYGPYTEKSSVPFILGIHRLAKGQKAQWLVNARTRHSFTYTGDCGKALYLLAQAPDSWNQVWHLPTARPPLTGEEFIKIAARKLAIEPKYMVMKKWMLRLAGIFTEPIRESYEMLYQNEFDYIFDSTKFEKRFDFTPTPYEKGISETIDHFKQRGVI
jgi:nucleoside-diphosphate-sugar epimerase